MPVFNGHNNQPETIIGGAGNDTIYGYDSASGTLGGPGDADSLVGGLGNDLIFGGDGNDILNGQDGADAIYGGDGDDLILTSGNTTGAGFEYAYGGNGNDTIVAGSGNLDLNGGVGNDLIDMTGEDTISSHTARGDDGADTILGGGGADVLIGGLGADSVSGGAGNDTVYSNDGDGPDSLDGGAGLDALQLNRTSIVFGLSADFSSGALQTLADGTTVANFESISFRGGSGNDTITSSNGVVALQNQIFGDAGNDVLAAAPNGAYIYGDVGNDTLVGGAGNDFFYSSIALDGVDVVTGGPGVDTMSYYNSLSTANGITVTLNGAAVVTVVIAGGDNDLISGIENIDGGLGNDYIAGDGNNNAFYGGNGSDTLIGGGGADSFDASFGNDFLFIDHFDTSINGGTGYDAVFVQDATGVNLNVGTAQAEYVYGWKGADTLDASTSTVAVALIGEAGADSLTGGAFNDYVYFDGLDTINAGAGYDALFYYQGTGQALANLNLNVAAANAEYVIGGGGNDTIFNTGSSTAVALIGGAGADTLTGGLGNDYLYGDSGAGNLGSDVFVVTNNAQSDVILDFSNGADRLNVNATGFTTFAQVQAAASASGASTIINFGLGNSVTLYNFALGSLDASDIIF
jgi:Ca2+-binding RTX toxin-like protein